MSPPTTVQRSPPPGTLGEARSHWLPGRSSCLSQRVSLDGQGARPGLCCVPVTVTWWPPPAAPHLPPPVHPPAPPVKAPASQAFPGHWLPKLPAGPPPLPRPQSPDVPCPARHTRLKAFRAPVPLCAFGATGRNVVVLEGNSMSQAQPRARPPSPVPRSLGGHRSWRPRPAGMLPHSGEGCTHVLSRVPSFSLVPLEAGVAFGTLQVTGRHVVRGCRAPSGRVRVQGPAASSGRPARPRGSLAVAFLLRWSV